MSKRQYIRREITIRGVTYPSIAAAARELGISDSALRGAYARGTENRIGEGQMKKPIVVRGVMFESMMQASREMGLSLSTIYGAIERGTLDRLGLGRHPKAQ